MELEQIDPRRLALSTFLGGFEYVGKLYFQPETNLTMQFPCTVYKRDQSSTQHADNIKYRHKKRWQITHICNDPDCPFPDMLEALPLCAFDRSFTSDNLNHSILNLYF